MAYNSLNFQTIIGLTVLLSVAWAIPAKADADTDAHAIAEKFAGANEEAKRNAEARRAADSAARNEAARRHAERLKAEESEMLERARSEAEARETERRQLEQAAREAEDQRRIAEEQARQQQEAIAAAEAERQRKDAERRQVEERLAREKEDQRIAAEREAMARQRQEEAIRLSEKLRRAREQREAAKAEREKHTVAGDEPTDNVEEPKFFSGPASNDVPKDWADHHDDQREFSVIPPPAAKHSPLPEKIVTVLLVMEPGHRGIRRFDKSADAVLCLGPKCYAGLGSDKPAKLMTRGTALGPGNTLGARAWGCKHSLTCVYRNIDLGQERAKIQPIDLRLLRHDRREARDISADSSCEVDGAGRLYCENPIRTSTWRAWIVPESVAERAGSAALDQAVRSGLPDNRSAELR